MTERPNKREWTRIEHALHVRVKLDQGPAIEGDTHNISANGLLIADICGVTVGVGCDVTLSRKDGDAMLVIRGRGEIVRSDEYGTAITLTLLDGEESYETMRNLILYNAAGEAGQAQQEFQDHIGLRKRDE